MLNDARQLSQPDLAASPAPQTRRQLTLADLIAAVASESRSDAEVAAVVAHLIESGIVRRMQGGRFTLDRG